ncbi:hypothetical protein M0805_001723 [Coniferiporia weirii]|nr:hypothetical protein M0805_001723 [Coniferiporia weirii]
MGELSLHFAAHDGYRPGQYKLVELSPELVSLVSESAHNRLTIRGREDDDAVLCTADKTYTIRAITISNSFCILTPPIDGESGDAVLRDSVKQILELSPSLAKLHRLKGLLKGCEFNEDLDEVRTVFLLKNFHIQRPIQKHEKQLYSGIKSELQASDAELEAGLRDRRILILNEELRPTTLSYLNNVLELILNALVSSSFSPEAAPATDIAESLQYDHEIPRDVSLQVMAWFGDLSPSIPDGKTWKMDMDRVVAQMGIGILSEHRNSPIAQDEFLTKWRTAVGDSFETRVDLSLLSGNYIFTRRPSTVDAATLLYFPSSELPSAPADRFSDLFLVQARWKAAEIAPFLSEIAIDSKERDRLLIKFARGITDKDGILWYTSRGGTTAG